jgi:exodeoxyribonuclease VII small subunit
MRFARHSAAYVATTPLPPAAPPLPLQPITIRWNLVAGASAVPTFEESLKKLESIVDQLEKGDLPLEESLKLFEEGVSLSAICKKELDEAEGKVQTLIKQRDGSFRTEPFPTDKSS